jgi:putative ABC transport system permease protein
VLLLVIGGILDALTGSSTGALRAQSAPLVVFSRESRDSLLRSRIEAPQLDAIEAVPGVATATGFGVSLLPARVPGGDEPADVAVFGYEAANLRAPAPPGPGEGFADRSLEEDGVTVGETLEVGTARVPIRVVGWVEDTSYNLQAGLWVDADTWRRVLAENVPDAALGEGAFQVALVTPAHEDDLATVAGAIEEVVEGVRARTIEQAIAAIPGVSQQQSVFGAIIAVTFTVAGLAVALFFALLTIERIALLGVLKAVGASSRQLAAGLTVQAVLIAAGALAIGGALTVALANVMPETIPFALEPGRVAFTAVGLVVTALVGSAISFRRIVRIDPAAAVGGAA